MMTGGKRINGKFFSETHSSGSVRYTHRFFIDGKLVSKAKFTEEVAAAKAEQARIIEMEEYDRRNPDTIGAIQRHEGWPF